VSDFKMLLIIIALALEAVRIVSPPTALLVVVVLLLIALWVASNERPADKLGDYDEPEKALPKYPTGYEYDEEEDEEEDLEGAEYTDDDTPARER
jgi:hypothetical protein